MRVLLENDRSTSATIATIGYFDGCHKGHQFVLEHLKQRAAMQGMEAMVVSFTNHPLRYFHPELELKLLTTPEEKLKLFTDYQLDSCLLLPFNEDISQLTSREFMALLAERYGVKHLLVGYDHQFGSDRATPFKELLAFGKEAAGDVEKMPAMSDDQLQVSSSTTPNRLQ